MDSCSPYRRQIFFKTKDKLLWLGIEQTIKFTLVLLKWDIFQMLLEKLTMLVGGSVVASELLDRSDLWLG